MKKRILIITSEPLNPDKILCSTFELTQAEILQDKFDVAILSVFLHTPIQDNFVALTKRIILFRELSATIKLGRQLLSSILYRFKGNRNHTIKWLIEGIRVYEGHGHPLRSVAEEDFSLKNWVAAGKAAFERYTMENGTPHLVHAHGRYLAAGVLALRLKQEFNHPYIYTEHSSRFPSGYVPAASIPMLNKVIDQSSLYIAVSAQLLKKVEETLDRQISNAVIIPNVIDPVFITPPAAIQKSEPLIFTVVANLKHRKGIDILLRSFKKAFHGEHNCILIIAGGGPEDKDLRQLRDYLGLGSCVHFEGKISKREVLSLLDRTHVFVLPSRFETFGVAIIEALSRGCPVLSTICGGPESIVPIDCGMLVDPENEDQLVEGLIKIRENFNKYNRNTIRQYAIQRFGPAAFLQRMEDIYNDDSYTYSVLLSQKEDRAIARAKP